MVGKIQVRDLYIWNCPEKCISYPWSLQLECSSRYLRVPIAGREVKMSFNVTPFSEEMVLDGAEPTFQVPMEVLDDDETEETSPLQKAVLSRAMISISRGHAAASAGHNFHQWGLRNSECLKTNWYEHSAHHRFFSNTNPRLPKQKSSHMAWPLWYSADMTPAGIPLLNSFQL